jgi:hypothetical protein
MAEFKAVNIIEVFKKYGDSVISQMGKVLEGTKLKDRITYAFPEEKYLFQFKIPQYGLFVDAGRKAGSKQPPIKPIKDWAKEKGLPQFRDARGRFIANDSRAFLIARSIARDGIKPRPFLYLIEENMPALVKDLELAFAKDLSASIRVLFTEAGLEVQ